MSSGAETPRSVAEAPAAQEFDAGHLLREAARQLGESLDPERVYDHFHALVADVIPHNGLIVSSYDDATGEIRCEYAWVDGSKLDPATLPLLQVNRKGEGMQSRVILSGQGLLANDVGERVERSQGTFYDVDAEGNVRKLPEEGATAVQAALMAPVKHAGRVVGVVQVMSEEHVYTPEQLELMEGIVAQMSAAVRNARLYRGLQESEARFRAIFDNAAVGIAEVALDGTWMHVNDRLCEITGYTRDELIEFGYQDVTHPDDLEADREHGQLMIAGATESYTREKRYRRKDGTDVEVSVTVSLVRDAEGNPVRFVSIVEDITARKRSEQERQRLVAAEEAARAIAREREQEARVLGAVGDGIALVDHSGTVRVWNPAAEQVTGLSAKEVVGRRVEEVLPGWSAIAGRLGRGGRPSPSETMPFEAAGQELWLSIVAVRSADGVVYAFRDETAQRRLDAAKTELVATVSHELRTPLSAVHGAAQTLLHRKQIADEQRAVLLAMIVAQTERLKKIADEFLLASRLEAGEVPVASERVDVAELAREAVESMRSQAGETIALELREDDHLPPARADAAKVRQVLVNLLDNAIKYSPRGGMVTVSVQRRRQGIRTSVQDQGLGIPRSDQQRVFEKFYRVDPHLLHATGGTGLGLYICRELVERMDGTIGVVSEEAKGSTFFVDLPLADDGAPGS
jgi:PAS domain S-box-containing protein